MKHLEYIKAGKELTSQKMIIKTDYSKTISYARSQNEIPVVRSIALNNNNIDKTGLTNIRLSVSFDPAVADVHEEIISELKPKGKITLDRINILPSASYLANLTEGFRVR